jgi:hypothetical protein
MAISCPPNCIKGTPLWSLYDVTDTNPEFCLFDSVIGEYTDIAGFPVLYYRAKSKLDRLYGEDANQDFYEPQKTKLYYQPTEEPNIIDGMGIRSDETLQYSLLPKSTFSRDIGGSVSGVPASINNAYGGTSYSTRQSVLTTGGSGTGLRVDIVTGSGTITKITINAYNPGSGYMVGDTISIVGGDSNSTFDIASVKTVDIGPMPGDVIKTLWNNRNYEVVDIGAEQSIFMGRKLIWEFILRPFRFSEQSLKAEEIYRSKVTWNMVYIYPDGLTADVTYADGTEVLGVPFDELGIDASELACGSTYHRNSDGSFDIMTPSVDVEEDYFPHPTYELTAKPVEDKLITSFGDNEFVETESNRIDGYDNIDDIMFSYANSTPVVYGTSVNAVITQTDINGFSQFNSIEGEKYTLEFILDASYLYIVTPVSVNLYEYIINGLAVVFEETTDNFLFDGEAYTCTIHKSQYKINGRVVLDLIPVG